MEDKKIKKIDFALITGLLVAFLAIAGIVGFRTPYVIAPQDNYTTNEDSVLFSFKNSDKILIDELPNKRSNKQSIHVLSNGDSSFSGNEDCKESGDYK